MWFFLLVVLAEKTMGDDTPEPSVISASPVHMGWANTMECDAASIRAFRKHLPHGRAVLVSFENEIVRVEEFAKEHPQTSRLGAILNVDLDPPAQGGMLAQRINLLKKIYVRRTILPHATYPSVFWMMEDPADQNMDWRDAAAPPIVPAVDVDFNEDDDIVYDEPDAYPFYQTFLIWITGAGVSLASGAAAVITLENKKGFLGVVLGMLCYTGWANFPP